ncbi:MAG: helix-turn-helix domain-containing protein [Proteobacteria bacterium]|nr:helix-turn-helix domain-containing protein [Pseudomonadota bacterium]
MTATPTRSAKASIAVASATLLDFRRALVNRKYSRLFSRESRAKPCPKGPSKELIQLVVETQDRNPTYCCPRIAMLVANVLGNSVDEETVRRILKKYYKPLPGKRPSWLLPIGNAADKLWSVHFLGLIPHF